MLGESYARSEDLERTRSSAEFSEPRPSASPTAAHERGRDQLGTRGAGNHFPAAQESSQSQEICSRSRFTPAVEGRGILICAGSMPGLAEEAPIAYEDVSRVVEVVHNPRNCEENCETGAHCRNQKVKMLERLRRATP
jgi:RNA-splicing ligase RtcB